jgi:hypothetical protein
MLGMKKYTKSYISGCRARVNDNLLAYRKQVGNTPSKDFEARYFNDQVLLLDYMFVHRLTGIEGKDGNALNEVRILCNSILLNNNKLQIDKLPGWPNSAGSGMKLPREKSILKLQPGKQIQVSESDFMRLSNAFFEEIENRYM